MLDLKLNHVSKRGPKSYQKKLDFIISLAQSLQNHGDCPHCERTPVLKNHKIQWSLYADFNSLAPGSLSCYMNLEIFCKQDSQNSFLNYRVQ